MAPEARNSAQQTPGGRRRPVALLFTAMWGCLTFAAVLPGASLAAVVVHTPEEVLAEWTLSSAGRLFFQDPDGGLYEFITDIDDADIGNKGTGAFHTADPEAVRRAVDAIEYPIDRCTIEVFVLPYPRRGLLDSSAGNATVYLSPGVAPYLEFQIHSVIAHEVGHLVHNQLLPDGDVVGWDRYRSLRGIEDVAVYNARAQHRYRPHEIFAEDFRFLFGGDLANYSGSIENSSLALPTAVPGLSGFFGSLVGTSSVAHDLPLVQRLHVFPNPTRGGVSISFADGMDAATGGLELRIFDAQGRLIGGEPDLAASSLRWEGRLSDGNPAPPGLYFVEVRRGGDRWVGKILVAR